MRQSTEQKIFTSHTTDKELIQAIPKTKTPKEKKYNYKMSNSFKQMFLKGKHTNGQQIYEKQSLTRETQIETTTRQPIRSAVTKDKG